MRLSKKDLEILLENVPEARGSLGVKYEQYPTPARIAAELAWKAYLLGDVEGKLIADLGCGTGRLACAMELLGGRSVCVELDETLLKMSPCVEKVRAFVPYVPLRKVDTVVMNPPFGTKRKRADRPFLEAAIQLSEVLYIIHHKGALRYLTKFAKEKGYDCELLGEYDFELKQSYEFHKSRIRRTEVIIVRCVKRKG